jgi:LacI family transcriptional regulator
MRASGAAVVHLSPHALGEPEINVDNIGGIAAMVRALVDMGHRRIAFLGGPAALYVARQRLDGYFRALAEAGIEADDRLVIPAGFTTEDGAAAVDALLEFETPFTAIACANDLLALGALRRLHALGIDVPTQVSLAGFDDIPMAAMTAPSLSTVRLPLRDMGRRGFAYAHRVWAGERPEPSLMPTTVVLRDSTAPPPKGT